MVSSKVGITTRGDRGPETSPLRRETLQYFSFIYGRGDQQGDPYDTLASVSTLARESGGYERGNIVMSYMPL